MCARDIPFGQATLLAIHAALLPELCHFTSRCFAFPECAKSLRRPSFRRFVPEASVPPLPLRLILCRLVPTLFDVPRSTSREPLERRIRLCAASVVIVVNARLLRLMSLHVMLARRESAHSPLPG